MMNTRLLFSFMLLFVFSLGFGQANHQQSSSKVDTDRTITRMLDSIFSSDNGKAPGVAISVLKNGKVLARRSYGMASLEHAVPFTHSTVVRIPYSEGREFIAVAAALMDLKGLLSLDDKVRKYFPKLPEWSDPVTIYDLLNHRSGFVDEWATLLLSQASMTNRFDKSQFLDLLYRQPKPEVEPGKGYMYSNSDFGLLRLILDKVTDQDLGGWMRRMMFEPLGMRATLLHDDKDLVIANFASHYFEYGTGYRKWTNDKTSPGGNYFIATTASDLEKWAVAHADTSSDIAGALERLFKSPQLMPGGMKDFVFGYKIKPLGSYEVFTHQGVNRYNYISSVKEKGVSVVMLSNSFREGYPYHEIILTRMLGVSRPLFKNKDFPKVPVSYSQEELRQFTGVYLDADTVTFESFTNARKEFFELIVSGDSLKMKYGTDVISLDYISPGVFKDSEYPSYIEFTRGNNGVLKIKAHQHQVNRVDELVRDTAVNWHPSQAQLASYAGRYYSPHLDTYWHIVQDKEGKLVVKRSTIKDTELDAYLNGEFRIRVEKFTYEFYNSYVRFHVDGQGKVTHLTVHDPRLMHHRFDRVQ